MNAKEVGKLMVKDFKDLDLGDVRDHLKLLFNLLQMILNPLPNMALVRSSQQIVGKIKKGMPGASQFGQQVEINISSFFTLIQAIFSLEATTVTKANQVSGLNKSDYSFLIQDAKSLSLSMVKNLIINYRDLCLPQLMQFGPLLLKYSHEAMQNCDLQCWFEILKTLK